MRLTMASSRLVRLPLLLLPLLLYIPAAADATETTTGTTGTTTIKPLKFGLINGNSEFFEPVAEAFLHICETLGVSCVVRAAENDNCPQLKHQILDEFLAQGDNKVDGVALQPCGEQHEMAPLFADMEAAGVPVVTVDEDVANVTRLAYVGTDHIFLGRTLAKLLRQLQPKGGTFAMVGANAERAEGFVQEITLYNDKEGWGDGWYEIPGREALEEEHSGEWMVQLEQWANLNADAIITMKQSPMRHENWTQFVDRHRHRNITFIGTDGADYQLDYLSRRYVDGLVGQLPWEMGSHSAQVLYDFIVENRRPPDHVSTNIVAYNVIPLELPPADVDQALIGNSSILGFTLFGIVALTAIGCTLWTFYYRTRAVVRAAQPFFLFMVAGGVLIMSSTLVPLGYDDDGDPSSMTETRSVAICMSIPWLGFTGFAITFSALFSKTWRINRLFHSESEFTRVSVQVKDVLGPFAALLISNTIVLICWQVLDPLRYVREEKTGTDYWNRVISSAGVCQSDKAVAYLAPLAVLNFGVVVFASWQAHQARKLEIVFSESRYIALTVFSMFQAFCTGIPVVVVVRDEPKAFYLVLTIMIFCLCMAILLLTFGPKVVLQRSFSSMTEQEQTSSTMNPSIQRSSLALGSVVNSTREDLDGTVEDPSKGMRPEEMPPAKSTNEIADVPEGNEESLGGKETVK